MAIITLEKELHNLELEQLLLHILVFDEQRLKVMAKTYPAVFSSDEFKTVFKVIKSLNGNCDLMTIAVLMEQRYDKAQNATISLLSTDPMLKYWRGKYDSFNVLRQLKDMLFRRTAFERAKNIIQSAERSSFDSLSKDILNEANKILILDRKLLRSDKSSLEELVKSVTERINSTTDTVITGFEWLNKRIYGLSRGHVSSIRAMPGHFKSSFCDCLIAKTIEKTRIVGLIISLEDPAEERVKRIIAPYLDISLTDMKFKKITVNYKDIEKVLRINLHSKLHVVDVKSVLTADDAVGVIYDIKPDFIVVDYIQNFVMQDQILGIINAIKSLEAASARINANCLVVSQPNDKKIAMRDDKMPTNSDDNWTSKLHQSSAEMFSLYYGHQMTQNPFDANQLRMRITKSKYSGSLGEINLIINPDQANVIGEIEQ